MHYAELERTPPEPQPSAKRRVTREKIKVSWDSLIEINISYRKWGFFKIELFKIPLLKIKNRNEN